MRIALAQINSTVGDLDGNRDRIVAAAREAREAGADLVLFPELASPGTRPRICSSAPTSSRPPRGRSRRSPRETHGHRRARRLRRTSTATSSTRAPSCADGEVKARLPQALPPELRRLRRGPLLPARPRPPAPPLRRHARRADDLRGHLAARPARDRARARGRARDREPLRVAVPPRQGPAARGDARPAGPRQRLLGRARERGRRPGRAPLRRPQRRRRPGRARSSPARPRSRRRSSSPTSTPTTAVGRRLSDARRRALARERATCPDPPVVDLGAPREPARARTSIPLAPLLGRARGDAPRARARPARLRRRRTGSRRSSSASRAASTPRSPPRSRRGARARAASWPSRCRRASARRRRGTTRKLARREPRCPLPRASDRAARSWR